MLQPVLVIVAINLKTEEPLFLSIDAPSDMVKNTISDLYGRAFEAISNINMIQLLRVQTVLL